MVNKNELYAASIALANIFAKKLTIPELAVLSSFLSSLAANISIAIQTENLRTIACAEETQPDNQKAGIELVSEIPEVNVIRR